MSIFQQTDLERFFIFYLTNCQICSWLTTAQALISLTTSKDIYARPVIRVVRFLGKGV